MKLAEALQERADLNRKIEELRRRLANVILVQEGEEPAEEPAEKAPVARLDFLVAVFTVVVPELAGDVDRPGKVVVLFSGACHG